MGERQCGSMRTVRPEPASLDNAHPHIYSRPHSRRCNCNRISWIALKTTVQRQTGPEAHRVMTGPEE